jgi:hypothetical protein
MTRWTVLFSLVTAAFLAPLPAEAQSEVTLSVTPTIFCSDVDFELTASGGGGTYDLAWDFGDGELLAEAGINAMPHVTSHTFPGTGEYAWSVLASDSANPALTAQSSADLVIGPQVVLMSDPFPPLLTLEAGSASLSLSAQASGGTPPYLFAWDLDGDGAFEPGADPASPTAKATFTAPGSYTLGVEVTDDCGLVAMDTLLVVVFDEGHGCHPMAQRIAEAVSGLFPNQAEKLYSCEDIFDYFTGGLTGNQLGFGRMWHAYRLALTMDELTWEQILDWHLNVGGWGLLLQLQRAGQALDGTSVLELYTLAVSGEHSMTDLRHALRAAVQYGADIEEALAMLEGGASPGEIKQVYRLSQDLEMAPEELDAFLEGGASVSEMRHAARVAKQYGADWTEIAASHAAGQSWGAIQQALRRSDEATASDTGKPEAVEARENSAEARMATRIASQFGVTLDEVLAMFGGTCAGDWSCVRANLREQGDNPHGPHGGGKPEG